ncbi:MAG: tetratricopeptide repeat protein [Prevotella sp.]|nr:tetratricopeptide repeat protein [Prevotella sp.]
MQAIKYLLMGVLMTGFSSAAMAQDGTKADVDAVKQIISSKPADLDKQLKPYVSKNKKNADNLVAFGRALYEAKDTARAHTYADMALKASKYQCAPAFILLGDIEALREDTNAGGNAAAMYDQAITADPKNAEAYYKYANVYRKINPTVAVMRLNELKQQRPDVAVDALVGRIYYMSNDFDKALAAYDKADMSKMEERDLSDYAMAAFFKQKNQKALDIAKFGLGKKPRHAAFNRLAFFNSTDLQQWDNALMYADALFNKSDSAKFSYYDYTYYGKALAGAKQHDKAIEMYKKALAQEDMDNKAKRAGVIKDLSDAYKQQEDYPNAIKHYEDYLNNIEKATANDLAALATLHMQHAGTLSDEAAKKEAFQKADGVYADLAAKYENAVEYATFMRARVNAQMDPDSKLALAKPYYEKLIELIEPRAEKDNTERARIIESYRYMIAYNFIVKEDKETAKSYAEKLIAIDPDNDIAKQVLDATK